MPSMLLRGVRSIDIESPNARRAADFYEKVWGLERIASANGSIYLRGSGAYHHILAIHGANGEARLRRVTFDAPDRDAVLALHAAVSEAAPECEQPHSLDQP